MENNKNVSWLKANYVFLLTILCEVLLLVGIFTSLISTKGATLTFVPGGPDWDPYYEAAKAHSREIFNIFKLVKEGTATPFFILYGLSLISVVTTLLGKFVHKNFYIGTALFLLCLGVLFLFTKDFYAVALTKSILKSDFNADYAWVWEDVAVVADSKLLFGSTWSSIFAFASSLLCFSLSISQDSINVKDMAEIGVLSAMAIGLQFIKIQIGSTGGSINLGLIPLFVVALRKGPAKGFIASAFVFGLITCLTDGYGLNTYPFDYLIGFGGCACLGFFKSFCFTNDEKGWSKLGFIWIAVGVLLASVIRFIGSSASSMINYGYTLTAAMGYNYVYVFVTGAVSLVAMEALYIPIARVNKLFPTK